MACGGRPAGEAGSRPAADTPAPRTAASMPVDSSATLFHAYQTGYGEPTTLVLRDRAAWEGAWGRLHRGGGAPAAPAVDFAREMVLVVALGERPSGGYDVAIDAVAPDVAGGGATVRYTAREPGEGCMSTQALTSPAIAVRAARVAGAVRFERHVVRSPC
jgi:hypothetical protein